MLAMSLGLVSVGVFGAHIFDLFWPDTRGRTELRR